ncbi:MAG TPA: PIN domain-containing protein [Mucilaginibacter sp.]|nr:PIN domain-containing protein [Mucilaginibacter sp.]
MKIIVDANIVFSGILNSDGKIGDLLINSKKYFNFIAPEFLRYEIKTKYERLQSISGLSIERIIEAEYQVCKEITFISEEQINPGFWNESLDLVHDIDIKDVQYVAYAKQFRCKIWSGDKKLFKGLIENGFVNLVTTDDLFAIRTKRIK